MRDRRDLGKWYTPPAVADLALAAADVAPGRDVRVLDPTCGDGAFLARARERGVDPAALVGVDVDPDAERAARARVPGARIVRRDLFDVPAGDLGAFDAVVGNPPYVRQERLPREAKDRIRARLAADFPDVPADIVARMTGRGDLAVACAARALRLARPGGRVALVVSSALFDAGYARPLWQLVARFGRVDAVLDAPRERWFADAAVNTVIVVLERTDTPRGASVVMARLRRPTAEAARTMIARRELARVADLREAPAGAPDRWAAALRSPDAWLELEGRAGAALAPLGALAEVRRGVTSGANDVFYLTRARARELAIEPEVLVPLVRAPRGGDAARIAIDPQGTSHVALACPPELGACPNAARYLGARADVAARPTLRARSPWWAIPARPARVFLTKAYAARFVQRLAPVPVVADQRVYSLHPAPGLDAEILAAVLNSTFTAIALESLGRASMGEGALEWTVDGAASIPVLDPRRLSAAASRRAREALRELAARPIGDVASERARDDRRALDLAVAAASPEAAALLPDLHDALVTAVHRRAARPGAKGPRRDNGR